MEREPQLPTKETWGVYCETCGFESYRGLTQECAVAVAQGHVAVTKHTPELYEIDFNKELGWVNQSRPSQRQIDAMIDMSG
jgi:hypothetical protein